MKYIAPWDFKDRYINLKTNKEIKCFINKVLYVMLDPTSSEHINLISYLYSLDSVILYFDIFYDISILSYTYHRDPEYLKKDKIYLKLEDINFTEEIILKRRFKIINDLK